MKKLIICCLIISLLAGTLGGCSQSISTSKTASEEVKLFPVKVNEKWGFIDENGNLVIQALYENTYEPYYTEGLAAVKLNGKWGFIDSKGQIVAKHIFDSIDDYDDYSFCEGMAPVRLDGKWGYINTQGKVIIEPQYESATLFSEGLARVITNGKYGFIDRKGRMVIEPKFTEARGFSEGLAVVKEDCWWEYINKNGKVFFRHEYRFPTDDSVSDPLQSFHEGLAAGSFGKEDKWGFIDKHGKMVIEPAYGRSDTWPPRFSEGLAAVGIENENIFEIQYGFIDATGKMIIPARYFRAESFNEGLAVVAVLEEDDLNYGYIDKTGKTTIKPQFEEASDFNYGLASVSVEGKYGIIDKSGQMIIQPKYEEATPVSSALVRVLNEGTFDDYSYIDLTGKVIWPKQEQNYGSQSKQSQGNNIANGGFAAQQGDWIYYLNPSDDDKLYKMRTDGSGQIC